MRELYLNGILIELDDNESITITKQANNFKELKDRQASFTNKFKVPKTPNNIDAFDELGVTGNTSKKPYQNITARYVVDSVPIVAKGSAQIKSLKNKFDVVIYDGNIHLFETLGTKKIKELDLTSLDHELTLANFTGSFSNTSGYIYAVSDFGNFDENKIEINYQLPSFFVHTIWDKIFSEAEFTKDFTPDTDLVITPKRGYNSELDIISEVWSDSATGQSNSASDYQTPSSTDLFYNVSLDYGFEPNQSHLNAGVINITETGNYYIKIVASGTYTPDSPTFVKIKVYSYLTDGVVSEQTCTIGAYAWSGTLDEILTFESGDVVYFTAEMFGGWEYPDTVETLTLDSGSTLLAETTTDVTVNVIASSFIGEMTQAQFIKDIMQYYGLTFSKVKDSMELNFKKSKDLLTGTADDWSDIFVKVNKEVYTLSNYGQKNRFAYNYRNSDDVPFADGLLLIDNDTLKPEMTQLTRPYNACETSDNLLNSETLTFTPFWEAERDDDGTVTKWKPISSKNYIGKIVLKNESINYGTSSGGINVFTGDVAHLSFKYLDYETILEDNYSEIKMMLDWNRVLDVDIKMDAFYFDSLDLLKLKYIKQLGGYFYLNKSKYKGQSTTSNELVFVPREIVNNLYVNSGNSENGIIGSGDVVIQLDGSSSRNYDSIAWKLISIPSGADTPTFDDAKNISPKLTILDKTANTGDYVIRLTLTKDSYTDYNELQITIT